MPKESFFKLERPLHVLPEKSQIRATHLRQFPKLVKQLGGDCKGILSRHDISPRLLGDSNSYIDCQAFVNLFEDCAVTLKSPLFGLRLAELQSPDVYGGVLALCRSAPTLREALSCLIQFLPVMHCSGCTLSLREDGDIAELCWGGRLNVGKNAQANFQGMYLNLQTLKNIGGPSVTPSYVMLPVMSAQSYKQEIEAILGCPVLISDNKSCIGFRRDYLDMPVPGADGPLFHLLYSYMYQFKNHEQQTVVERVHAFISRAMGSDNVTIEACAQELNLSLRTLQMRLKEEGKTYSDIIEYHRVERAKYVLKHSELPIPEVADSLGYAERTSFGRAFKRWTGLSPQQYRQNSRE